MANPAGDGRRSRATGIREVAAAAGVSPTTVSHALNGMGRISEATRRHVLEVAARLDYRANPSARNMRSGASGIIAVINQLSEGATWEAADLEYIMRLNQAVCRAAWERDAYPTLLPPGVDSAFLARIPLDGAIVADPVHADRTLRALDELGIPTVTVGRDDAVHVTAGAAADDPAGGLADDAAGTMARGAAGAAGLGRGWWADNDIVAATAGVLDHLAAGGAERVCLVSADTGQSYMTDAVAAYAGWCAARGAESRLHVLPRPFRADDCYAAIARECAGPDRADALYLVVEAHVRPALAAVADAGLTVPGDIQVAVASDSVLARTGRPALTALDLHPELIGAAVADLLAARMAGEPQRTELVRADLVVRGSTR